MGQWVLNEKGFFNRGSGRPPYQPVAQKRSRKINQPLSLKERYQSAIRAKIRAQMEVAAAETEPVTSIERDVAEWLDQVQRESSTVQGTECYVDEKLREVGGPMMPVQVRRTASRMLTTGIATTPRQATKKAIAEEVSLKLVEKMTGRRMQSGLGAAAPPVRAGGTTFAEWFGRASSGAGAFGRVMNTWADWTCSPADTAIGSFIAGIWTGPAGAAATAETATELKSIAGCDLWQLGARLKTQLGRNYELFGCAMRR